MSHEPPCRTYDRDGFREVPSLAQSDFPGMTELKRGDRTVQMKGTGPDIRKHLVMHMGKTKP